MKLQPIGTAPFNRKVFIYNKNYSCMPIASHQWACMAKDCTCHRKQCERQVDDPPMGHAWVFEDEDFYIDGCEREGVIGMFDDPDLMPTHYMPIPTEEELNNEQQGAQP